VDLHAIRQGLADLLNAIPDLRAYAYTPTSPRPAQGGMVIIDEADDADMVAYHQSGPDTTTIQLTAVVIVSAVDVAGAQQLLDDYRSTGNAKSIPDALESMPSLNGAAQSVLVRGAGPTIDYDLAAGGSSPDGRRYWSMEFMIEVFA
jgi:hypothetical protein